MQIIAKRLAQAEIKEESEELRLQLVQQIRSLVDKFKSSGAKEDLILTAYNDIIDVLVRTVRDPYHLVQRESCEVVVALANGAPCFRYRAEVLVKHLKLMLGHRYTVNRVAAIRALVECALHILTNNNCVVNIIMDICRLLMDDVPMVRLECGRAGIRFGLELKDRYSNFSKILPLILCCLRDPIEDVRTEIAAGWIKVGELYYNENEEDMKKYLLVDKVPENYPDSIQRPTFQCRQLVQRHLQMVGIILHEMEEWQENVRLHSVKLLEQVVLHSEKLFATQFPEVYPVLAYTCVDHESEIAKESIHVATLLGHLLEFDAWFEFALVQLETLTNLAHLVCFGTLFKAASDEKAQKLEPISKVLLDSSFYHGTAVQLPKKARMHQELLNLAKSMIEALKKTSNKSDSTEQNLYCVSMKVISLTTEDEIVKMGQDVIYQLANAAGIHVDELHQRHLQHYLDLIDGLDVDTEEISDPVILLCGVIQNTGLHFSNIDLLQPKILIALTHAPPEGKIKIFASIAAAIHCWDNSKSSTIATHDEQFDRLKIFVTDVVRPSLQWSAGTGAESVRCMASACFCAITQFVDPVIGAKLIEEFATDIVALIDDNEPKTRCYAVRTLLNVGELDEAKLKPLVFAVMSRLDDSNQDVRLVTATVLGRLRPKKDEKFDWEALLSQIINRMIIFCEAPETKLREKLLESLKEIQKRDPDIYLKQVSSQKDEWTAVKEMLMKLNITE